MRIQDDSALLVLPIYKCKARSEEILAVDQVRKHIARAHRRQLVRVAHENEPRPRLNRLAERLGQHQIHHRSLVDNYNLLVQRSLGISPKCHESRLLVIVELQQPVHRAREMPTGLHDPLGGPPCRSGNSNLEAAPLSNRNQSLDNRGLARARAARDNRNPAEERVAHGLLLLRGELDTCLALRLGDERLGVPTDRLQPTLRILQRGELPRNTALSLVISIEIHDPLAVDIRELQPAVEDHILSNVFD